MELDKLIKNTDRRGTLVEAFKFPNDGQLFYVVARPNEARGNHYHTRKTEKFLVICGSAIIQSKDRDSGNIMKVEVSGYNPMVAEIPPNHTHSITATEEGCIFLVWVDEIYNPDDTDTIGEEI